MAYSVDPRILIPPDEGQTFVWDSDADLTSPTITRLAANEYLIKEYPVSSDVIVIRGIHPYLRRRTNVTLGSESVYTLHPEDLNDPFTSGWFIFKVLVNGQSPIQFVTDYAAKTVTTNPSNTDRVGGPGIASISSKPWEDAQASLNSPLFWYAVKPGSKIQLTFTLLRWASANPTPNAPVIPNNISVPPVVPVTPTARYDYAGAVICGNLIPAQRFSRLRDEVRHADEPMTALSEILKTLTNPSALIKSLLGKK